MDAVVEGSVRRHAASGGAEELQLSENPRRSEAQCLPNNLKITHHPDGYHVLAIDQSTCAHYIKTAPSSSTAPAPSSSTAAAPTTATETNLEAAACTEELLSRCSLGNPAEETGGKKKARLAGWRRRRQRAAADAARAAAKAAASAAGAPDETLAATDAKAAAASASTAAVVAAGRVSSTRRRMRNPFSSRCSTGTLNLPDWAEILSDVSRPALLDIGSARGVFVEQMAAAFPDSNYIGVEIREQFVEEALARTADQRLKEGRRNLAYLTANVLEGTAMSDILSSMQRAGMKVGIVTIQFPDPWVSPKHRKRRTVSPHVARALATHLAAGAHVYVSSDVPAVLWDAAETLRAAGGPALAWHVQPRSQGEQGGGSMPAAKGDFSAPSLNGAVAASFGGLVPWTDEEGLLLACPVGGGRVFSERDAVCEELWRRVYRVLFTRTKGNVPLSTAATEALGDEAWTAGYAADTASSTWEMEQWTDADRDDPALI